MKSVNFSELMKCIPFRIHLGRGEYYEVVWVEDFKDGKTCGETRFDSKQIAIKTGMSEKLTVITYLHECIHAISFIYDVGLTETQVLKLENAIYYILKPFNIFKRGTSVKK